MLSPCEVLRTTVILGPGTAGGVLGRKSDCCGSGTCCVILLMLCWPFVDGLGLGICHMKKIAKRIWKLSLVVFARLDNDEDEQNSRICDENLPMPDIGVSEQHFIVRTEQHQGQSRFEKLCRLSQYPCRFSLTALYYLYQFLFRPFAACYYKICMRMVKVASGHWGLATRRKQDCSYYFSLS